MSRIPGSAVIVLTALGAPPAWAADASPAAVGSRVRILAGSERRVVGSLLAVEPDRLLIASADRADPIVVTRSSIQRFEVSHGRKSKEKGALIGGLIGAGLGAAWGFAASRDQSIQLDTGAATIVPAGVLGGLGAIVGAAVTHGERWQAASLDGAAVAVVPTWRGAAVRVSVGF